MYKSNTKECLKIISTKKKENNLMDYIYMTYKV